MTTWALRLYTLVVAIVCTAALAFAIHSQNASTAWKKELHGWKDVADRAAERDQEAARNMRQLANRYNDLVGDTKRSQAKLLKALRQSHKRELDAIRAQQQLQQALAARAVSGTTSYSGVSTVVVPTVSSAGVPAVAAVPPPVAVPTPTPSSSPPPPATQPS